MGYGMASPEKGLLECTLAIATPGHKQKSSLV